MLERTKEWNLTELCDGHCAADEITSMHRIPFIGKLTQASIAIQQKPERTPLVVRTSLQYLLY
jgi:hypothetical protein